jgi:SNF2 family DNA or RNA helicase
VTLHAARTVVLHDLHWTLTSMLQAEARIHRIGQKRGCQSIWMVAENTIDALLAPVLEQKARAMAKALGQDAGLEALAEVDLASVSGAQSIEQQVDAALALWRAA